LVAFDAVAGPDWLFAYVPEGPGAVVLLAPGEENDDVGDRDDA
jgi:hypothetical protein